MSSESCRKPVVLIAGPTGSGKSAVAVELARRHAGVIINADAMQVYRELRVLTARPSLEDERSVSHELFGFVPAAQPFSVGLWLVAAQEVIVAAWRGGRLPILTGGTGLYFKALEEGLARLPEIPFDVRQAWRLRLLHEGSASLYAELSARDPSEARRLKPTDGHRIARALEVLEATGKPLSYWQAAAQGETFLDHAKVLRLFLNPPRRQLYEQIDQRFDAMIPAGVLDEAKKLFDLGLDSSLPAMKALGLQDLGRTIRGEVDLEVACCSAKRNTRRYAKRQLTWARRNMIAWNMMETQFSESSEEQIFKFLRVQG